jgi:hypothetical protein
MISGALVLDRYAVLTYLQVPAEAAGLGASLPSTPKFALAGDGELEVPALAHSGCRRTEWHPFHVRGSRPRAHINLVSRAVF